MESNDTDGQESRPSTSTKRRRIMNRPSSSSSSSGSTASFRSAHEEIQDEEEISSDEIQRDSNSNSSSSSSSTSSGFNWDASEAENESEVENDDDVNRVLEKAPPKPKYSLIQDLIDRERGRLRPSTFMRNRVGGLNVASRFELAAKLDGHSGCVNALNFNADGEILASGSDDLDVILWDWQRNTKRLQYQSGHRANVFQSKFLPLSGDSLVASTSRDGQVRLAELSEGGFKCGNTRKLAQHRGPSNKLAMRPSEPHTFISGGEDALVFAIDVRQPDPDKLLVQKNSKGRRVPIYSVDASPKDDHVFCTSGMDPYVRLFDRRYIPSDGEPLKAFAPERLIDSKREPNVTAAVFSYDGSEVIGSYNDDDIYLFKTESADVKKYDKHFEGHRNNNTVKGVNFYGARSEFVISGSDCGNIFIWSKETEAIVNMFEGDEGGVVNVLEPHPSLPIVATSGLDDQVKIFYPTSREGPNREEIEKTVMENCSSRKNRLDSEFDNSHLMWALFRHMDRRRRHQRQRRRARGGIANADDDSDDDDDDDDDDDSSTDSDDGPGPEGIQCPTS